jgi:flagellar biosynthesis/type III secretory pathway ATPase
LGTYHAGADRRTDEAVAAHEKLESFLKQDVNETVTLLSSTEQLAEAIS